MDAATFSRLAQRLGPVAEEAHLPVPVEVVELPESWLAEEARAALAEAVGVDHVREDRLWRIEHAGGKGYPDLYRIRTGDGSQAPDVVVLPADAAQVQAVIELCVEHDLALVPFGGGTSVVGGVGRGSAGDRPVVSLDLRRLDQLLAVDPVARTATFQPGLRGPDIETALHPHGLTLGHYPQSHQEATLGGYVATRSAGQASSGYGRIDDNVLGVRLATPRGELVLGGRSPASAAGPRLLDLVVGSEGALGVITEATLAVAPLPTAKRHAAWVFPSTHDGVEAVRAIAQDLGHGLQPDVVRLSDEEETAVNLTLAGRAGGAMLKYAGLRGQRSPALLVLQWEGTDEGALKARQRVCDRLLGGTGGRRLPSLVARSWEKGRFSGPYLRDQLMDRRVLVETLETATTWDNVERLHAAVSTAIRSVLEVEGRSAIVMAHISHVYAAGASLYFTFATPEAASPLDQWREVKAAASRAIVAGGGTITHHHAVGTDHRPFLGEEIGDLGAGILRAVKAELDPTGVLNPGKLIPPLSGGA